MSNITKRKRVEEELAQAVREWQSIFDATNDVIWILDQDRRVLRSNKTTERFFHSRCDEIVGKHCYEIVHRTEQPIPECPLLRAQKNLRRETMELYVGEHWFEITVDPILDTAGQYSGVVHIVSDITQRKRREEELLRAQKLETVGVLAGGIAHDFNNLMAIVQGYIDLALIDLPPDHVSRQRLLTAMRSVERTKDLTSRLITFSRGGDLHTEIIDAAEIIRDAVQRTVKGTEVRVMFDFMENLWPAEMDELLIKQCFYNLTINAVEAMPEGGNLTIQVVNALISTGEVSNLKEGAYLKIVFTDEGIGISEEHLSKIFDPYFTTKGIGTRKGLGLGLSVCYSVLKKHDGHITVISQRGKGTSFVLYLPARAPLIKAKDVKKAAPTGTIRVLIMDDEPHIRLIERAYLEQMSYEVTDVKDGQEAINTYKKAVNSGNPFDLVILDLTVRHGIGGQSAMEQLLKIDPSVRAVIASGYVDDPVIVQYTNYGFHGALKKPFKAEELKCLMANIFHA